MALPPRDAFEADEEALSAGAVVAETELLDEGAAVSEIEAISTTD